MSETYIDFLEEMPSASGKTKIWQVAPRSSPNMSLGEIRWYAQWRRYCFYPSGVTSIFDGNCLEVLADFCLVQTREHKSK